MNKVKVKDEPGLVRDQKTGAILNIDNRALIAYKNQKKKNQEIDDLKIKVDSMEKSIINIERMLIKITEGKA